MNKFEIVLAQQRRNIEQMQRQWISSRQIILFAAHYAETGDIDRAIKLITETAENIENETTNASRNRSDDLGAIRGTVSAKATGTNGLAEQTRKETD